MLIGVFVCLVQFSAGQWGWSRRGFLGRVWCTLSSTSVRTAVRDHSLDATALMPFDTIRLYSDLAMVRLSRGLPSYPSTRGPTLTLGVQLLCTEYKKVNVFKRAATTSADFSTWIITGSEQKWGPVRHYHFRNFSHRIFDPWSQGRPFRTRVNASEFKLHIAAFRCSDIGMHRRFHSVAALLYFRVLQTRS